MCKNGLLHKNIPLLLSISLENYSFSHFLNTPFFVLCSYAHHFFFRITQCNVNAHNTMHTYPYEHTYANPTPMNTSEKLSRQGAVDGDVAYHWKHSADKSWNFRKMRAHVPNRGLEPMWTCSTIRNPTNWSIVRTHTLYIYV
jgi:hypothetical protein